MSHSGNFVGARLVEARLARGLSAAALAELIELTPSAMSQYENDRIAPRPDALEQLARQLNVPATFFFRPILRDDPDQPVFWRSLSSASKSGRIQAQQRFRWLREIVRYIHGFLEFPGIDLPKLALPADPLSLSLEDIEECASATRAAWGMGDGPVDDAILLLENHGIVVARTAFDQAGLDAFSHWSRDDTLPYVVLGTDKGSAVRSRYDAMHELGHLLLHYELTARAVVAKRAHNILEAQAFRFASALALPARTFLAELWAPTLDAFRALKERWKVSIGVMIYRCAELGVITAGQAQRLWINYSRRGWRRQEPLDDRMPLEQPRLLRRSFDVLITSGTRSRTQILAELALPANVVESLTGLPAGYFNESFGTAAVFAPRLREAGVNGPTGNVVPFSSRRQDQ